MRKSKVSVFILSVAFAVTLGSSVAFAKGYGAAGCGLGSLVFGSQPGIVQIFAATTNGTSGNQTFGITSGTSNCSDSSAFRQQQQEIFAAVNMSGIEQEMVAGKGEKLSAFASLLGCSDASLASFGDMTRKEFSVLEKHSNDPASFVKMVKQSIAKDPALANACDINV